MANLYERKMNPKLARLEREIGGVAERQPHSANRPRTTRPQNAITWLYRAGGRKLDAFIDVCGDYWLTAVASGRKLITIATRPPQPSPRLRKSKMAFPVRSVGKQPVARAGARELVLISMCFGLLIVFAVVLAVLFSQMKDMKSEIAVLERSLSAAKAQLGSVEKIAQQNIPVEAKISNARQRSIPIVLDDKDLKIVRQFIKVLPTAHGAQQRIHEGEEVPAAASVAVPDSLVDQLPKLRGARFLVDQNGAIILIGAGSKLADVVIMPQ